MLKPNEIKELCKFADGFEIDDGGYLYAKGKVIYSPYSGFTYSDYDYYDLFLTRAIDGINAADNDFSIIQRVENIKIIKGSHGIEDYLSEYHNGRTESIIQAKEKILVWFLEKK